MELGLDLSISVLINLINRWNKGPLSNVPSSNSATIAIESIKVSWDNFSFKIVSSLLDIYYNTVFYVFIFLNAELAMILASEGNYCWKNAQTMKKEHIYTLLLRWVAYPI